MNLSRLDFFIEKLTTGGARNGIGSDNILIFYDYMQIDTNLTNRLKFLSTFKNRFTFKELKAIFRGVQASENGKTMSFEDVLLKKFRKFGDEYEIKFILPK